MLRNRWLPKTMPILVFIPPVLVLFVAALFCYHNKIPIGVLMMDPVSTLKGDVYVGVLSNIGILLWAFTCSICFFTYALIKNEESMHDSARFVLYGGMVTSLLLLDDLFLFHERFNKSNFGLTEVQSCVIYATAVGLFLVVFRKNIMAHNYGLLVLGLFLLAFSLVEDSTELIDDALPENLKVWSDLIEDGPKFLGVYAWFCFFASACFQLVQSLKYYDKTH